MHSWIEFNRIWIEEPNAAEPDLKRRLWGFRMFCHYTIGASVELDTMRYEYRASKRHKWVHNHGITAEPKRGWNRLDNRSYYDGYGGEKPTVPDDIKQLALEMARLSIVWKDAPDA